MPKIRPKIIEQGRVRGRGPCQEIRDYVPSTMTHPQGQHFSHPGFVEEETESWAGDVSQHLAARKGDLALSGPDVLLFPSCEV